jgi:hypothetical protein
MSPKVVTLHGRTVTCVLPPLGQETFSGESCTSEFDLDALHMDPYLEVDTGVPDNAGVAAFVVGGGFWVALIGSIVVFVNTDGWLPVVGFLALCVVVGSAIWKLSQTASWNLAGRWAREKVALILVVLVGFGVPAAVLLFATQLFDQLRDGASPLDGPLNRVVMFRTLQAVFLGIATTFPALLYFLFDRQNTDTLRTRFLLALFRLDRRLETKRDWDARYGRQIVEAFGQQRGRGATRLLRARRAPVVVATAVIAIGWVLAFLNLDAVSVDGTGEMLAGGSLLRLFEPERGVVAFGFLGAYFFGVNTVLRSYLRGDLRPKAYSQITTRVLIVVVLASLVAITPLGDDAPALAVAFFAGIVPDTVLQWIWEKTRGSTPGRLDELQPLTELEGIDLYDRARLAEEGVTNVESLAHGDLLDLLLQTRIPPGRIVDWVDQAIFRLHLATDGQQLLDSLRRLGLRTATDFLTTVRRDPAVLLSAMGTTDDLVAPAQLAVLECALSDAEWVEQLLDWRLNAPPGDVVVPAPAPLTPPNSAT